MFCFFVSNLEFSAIIEVFSAWVKFPNARTWSPCYLFILGSEVEVPCRLLRSKYFPSAILKHKLTTPCMTCASSIPALWYSMPASTPAARVVINMDDAQQLLKKIPPRYGAHYIVSVFRSCEL